MHPGRVSTVEADASSMSSRIVQSTERPSSAAASFVRSRGLPRVVRKPLCRASPEPACACLVLLSLRSPTRALHSSPRLPQVGSDGLPFTPFVGAIPVQRCYDEACSSSTYDMTALRQSQQILRPPASAPPSTLSEFMTASATTAHRLMQAHRDAVVGGIGSLHRKATAPLRSAYDRRVPVAMQEAARLGHEHGVRGLTRPRRL